METVQHIPVLLEETLDLLAVRPGGVYADCTVGLGGHAEAILGRLGGGGRLIGLDRDEEALAEARRRLGERPNLALFRDNFKNLPLILQRLGVEGLDGCLLDLGVSSLQLDEAGRGFSFRAEAPLDMRMDRGGPTHAGHLVNSLSEERLARIFKEYGEEPQARRLAAEIVRRRAAAPIRTTRELADLAVRVKGARPGARIHPATQIFQALRIEVNQELEGLEPFLDWAIGFLRPGGRLAVIAFHSLEDRIAKNVFRLAAGKCVCRRPQPLCECPRVERVRILTPKPVTASRQEAADNPRSRSAKLRAVEKLGAPDLVQGSFERNRP